MEKNLRVKNICNQITKYSIYFAIFLIPILFLPFTSDAFDFNKQIVLIFLVFLASFSWILKSLISGKIEIKYNFVLISVGLFLLSVVFSTIFSVNKYGSFWGWPQVASEGLITTACLSIILFFIASVFDKKDIYALIKIFASSVIIVGVITVAFILFSGFGLGISNPLGSAGSAGILLAIFLPLFIIFLMISDKIWKIIFGFGAAICLVAFILINYAVIWWIVLISSAVLMASGVLKKKFFDVRWLALPMFFLAISVLFLLLHPQVAFLPNAGDEVSISQKTSLQIGSDALKQNFILGSGNGTFLYDYLKFRSKDISATNFWNISFIGSSSKILTLIPTIGVLGIVLFLFFILGALYFIGKSVFADKDDGVEQGLILAGLFSSIVSIIFACFLYNFNLTLDLALFALIALALGLTIKNRKDYVLNPNSFKMLFFVFLGTIVFIFGIGMLVIEGQRYYADIFYKNGLILAGKGDINNAILSMEKAASNNPNVDLYFTQLSQLYLAKMNKDIADSKISEENKTKEIQFFSANAINSAKIATDINPQSSRNWSIRGFIYQNFIGLSPDMQQWAEKSYAQALLLDQYNPYLNAQLGILSYQKKDYSGAVAQLKKTKDLNQAYPLALYYLGLSYDALGQKSNALAEFKILAQLNPDNQDIKKIINNLSNGNGALSGVGQAMQESPDNANQENQSKTK